MTLSISGGRSILYNRPFAKWELTEYLQSIIPKNKDTYIVTCIGSDRSTGDSLGPLTGSLLKRHPLKVLQIYGTLHEPLHALNLEESLHNLNEQHPEAFIIALDAALGKLSSIGHITCHPGPLQPGAALKKQLPAVGEVHISAVVNVHNDFNFLNLQNTRLSLVYDMAELLTSSLYWLDRFLYQQSEERTYT